MNDLADQVQSLFIIDIHFNAINMRMHTRLQCETPHGHGMKMYAKFKIDTGADNSLMQITYVCEIISKVESWSS